ncbi:MAG TPA: tetratricopeptide repeat protein [Gemmatimonadales bacterium]|nr:tetratricopeptide repeat protein [Gemmatimonadales bacterium]
MTTLTRELVITARERVAASDYYGALLVLDDLVGEGRAYADVHHLRGICLSLLDRPQEALGAFEAALAQNPRYVEAHLHRGLVLNQLGRAVEAAEAFAAARDVAAPPVAGLPAPVAARLANEHARLGDLYADAGALPDAISEYRRAVTLGPSFHDLRLRLARLLIEAGNPLQAREELERILTVRPEWLEARVQFGLARYLAGDVAGAREIWQACQAERPELERVAAYLAMAERIPG